MLRIGIAGNENGRGLEKDYRLIKPIIESLGHEVSFVQFNQPHAERYDLLICLEVVYRGLVDLSDAPPWLITNPEFLDSERIKLVRQYFSKVLCKTHESHRVCKELFGDMAHYVGFLSEDRFDPSVERSLNFLHIAGQSRAKNTEAVIDAWRWKKNGKGISARLFVVSDFPIEDIPNVTVLSKLTNDELLRLQNYCQFHLQPSATEGWSHVLHEAMSVNANICTVDAPPMNEIESAYRIPATGHSSFNSVKMYEVSALDVHKAVKDLLVLGKRGFSQSGAPRKEFLEGNEAFKVALAEHFTTPVPTVHAPRTRSATASSVAFIGNFTAEHSTENQILWALEQGLGYEVEKLQENKVGTREIYEACEYAQTLIWVRTPGWLQVPDEEMFALLDWCKNEGIKTLSVHLDKFWDIPTRESLIGKIPFWKTQYVFTADGSRQEDFAKRGVNHFWMKPAVSEVYCHPGTPRDEYRCDVGFVGAKEYHAEYPFRKKMVEFLQETYGERFKHIEGVRGHLLNDVYASMKVVVGDCFGAGIPNYWSDRVPETLGRYGLLLHPIVEGLTTPRAIYQAQNLEDLNTSIECLLSQPENHRRDWRYYCARDIRENDTWTIRMEEIIRTVNQL